MLYTSVLVLLSFTVGVYAGKGRARNKPWSTIVREALSGAWAIAVWVFRWTTGLYRREKHYIEAEVADNNK